MTEKTELAVQASEKIAVQPNVGLEPAPSYIPKDDRRGLESITRADIIIPRLALAQALSPQVTEGDPHRIEGCKAGDLFNSMTNQIYGGRTPVMVQIIRKDKPRAMQFRPVEDGGGVLDPNVPLDDPRMKWVDGAKPEATLFLDFLALILPSRELIALSFKSTGIKVARQLSGKILFRGHAIFAGVYAISTGIEQKPKPHQIYKIENAGWVTEDDYNYGAEMFEAVKTLDVTVIDRDEQNADVPAEEVPF